MNIIQLQEQLKNMPKEQLVSEMQRPSGAAPQFLVLSELQRRQRMEASFNAAKDAQKPQTTVAQDVVNSAGMPQQGLGQIAQAIAPNTDMAQNTKRMAEGGYLSSVSANVRDYLPGAVAKDPAYVAMAQRTGVSPEGYWGVLGPEARQQYKSRAERDRFMAMEPVGSGITFPTQEDLDRKAMNERTAARTRMPAAPDSNGIAALLSGTADVSPNRAAPAAPMAMNRPTYAAEMSPVLQAAYATADPNAPTAAPYVAPSVGATELNTPAIRNALGENQSDAGLATGLRDAANATESKPFWDFLPAEEDISPYYASPEPGPVQGPPMPPENPGEQNITPAAEPVGPTAEEVEAVRTGATGNSISTSLAAAAPAAESDLDRQLLRDKWFALARAGFALMASKSPTLGGAIGEAGMYGMDAFRQAQMDYDEGRQREQEMALEQQAMAIRAASAAGGGGGGASGIRVDPMDLINRERYLTEALGVAEEGLMTNPSPQAMDQVEALKAEIANTRAMIYGAYGIPMMSAPSGEPGVDFDATQGG